MRLFSNDVFHHFKYCCSLCSQVSQLTSSESLGWETPTSSCVVMCSRDLDKVDNTERGGEQCHQVIERGGSDSSDSSPSLNDVWQMKLIFLLDEIIS